MSQNNLSRHFRWLAATSLLVSLAACNGDDNQTLLPEPTPTLTTGAAVPPGTTLETSQPYNRVVVQESAPSDADIRTDNELGDILTDKADDLTLYVFAKDSPDVSVCEVSDSSQCANVWPPLFAAETAQPQGDYTIISRADGSRQWAYRGLPLYFFNGNVSQLPDLIPGDTNGFLVGGVWFVVRPDPFAAATVNGTDIWVGKGSILDVGADADVSIKDPLTELDSTRRRSVDGLTLYTFNNDPGNGTSVCNGECARKWPPLYADLFSIPPGTDFTIITRDNGTLQWAYRGKPLYFWYQDLQPGDTLGTLVPNWSLATR
ncbi:COG4315 family predicted lipoprotein [Thiothrix nivea]|uniref:Lipoprotein n=1 Tax=Thiothrix nivea (strain ATCC 35100 / DSM 5205 / JP2) TaxID=870187 RepID=A0A656HHI7_THINJ|nr:lipoprotein [Thiothrix nivea]EIJ34495.1 lipoprotein [Thiothrix nivea DSM 5205]